MRSTLVDPVCSWAKLAAAMAGATRRATTSPVRSPRDVMTYRRRGHWGIKGFTEMPSQRAVAGTWETFLEIVPEVNTILVATVGLLIVWGWREIRTTGRVARHRAIMVSATSLFALFLVLYLTRLIAEGPTSFPDANPGAPGWAYPFYLGFLLVHMALALVTVALIPVLFIRAYRKDFGAHKRLARKVAPMWLISIVMGIAVYFQLFVIWR